MKYVILFILITVAIAVNGQSDALEIVKDSDIFDVQLKVTETDVNDFARLEMVNEPPGLIQLNRKGKFQIAAKSSGQDGNLDKALNFWYADDGISGITNARNILSVLSNSHLILGPTNWDDPLVYDDGLITSPVGSSADLYLAAANDVFFDLDSDDNGSGRFVVRNSEKVMVMQVLESGSVSITGSLNPPSDRNLKENLRSVEGIDILNKLDSLDISSWRYVGDSTNHIGPMSQEFYAAFGLGSTDKGICVLDYRWNRLGCY